MLKLNDFKKLQFEGESQIKGGADPNVTSGVSVTYEGSYYPGGSTTGTWSSDYDGANGLEYCDLEWDYE